LTICPCCGFKFEGELRAGCAACGARAVGEPLARPEHELPSYGRALFVGAVGVLMVATFTGSTFIALLERTTFSLDFWSVVAAAETAAWHLKWLALPATTLALWAGARLSASIRRAPSRFAGRSIAHGGLAASALVTLMIVTFIGVTVPERLRQRQRSIDAAYRAQLYTIARAQLEYRALNGTLPASLEDLGDQRRLPDPDGSIAAALATVDPKGYKSWSVQARLPEPKSRKARSTALRRVSLTSSTDDMPDEGVSFTNYEMRLSGEDKILGTDDDWMIRDGVIISPSQATQQASSSPSAGDESAP
jgi:hypothetical protein